jgi:hypothetical protein
MFDAQYVWYFDDPIIGYCSTCNKLASWDSHIGLKCPACGTTKLSIFVWDKISKEPKYE